MNNNNIIKIKALIHKYSWVVLTRYWFEIEYETDFKNEKEAKEYFLTKKDIEYGWKRSQDIIDTRYRTPSDFGLIDRRDEDDTTDDYEETDLEITIKA